MTKEIEDLKANQKVFSRALVEGDKHFGKLEDNKKEISCIPIGNYKCKRVNSPRFGNTFEITNVANRTNILFHKGNTHIDTLGCVLLGSDIGYLKTNRAVLASKNAFNLFLEALEGLNEFDLSIMMI